MIFNDTIVVLTADAPPDLLPASEQMAVSHGAGGGEQNDGTPPDPGGPISAAHPTPALVRDGRLKPVVGAVLPLAEAAAAFAPDKRIPGKTIVRVAQD